ncbi:hypothetical protein HNV11_21865 [Spirosoma taeanense]|uniref:Uncharacterized protein n=1 Tax=Spirosoma taeanense TaxID=2735870 RepID=A0A6M5YCY5_9BACT|nr:hypothetical protein [Spirosoma taeanense]QJW91839.1 hypothetical protein HNV11_21865 [Spirosoma taeanense]
MNVRMNLVRLSLVALPFVSAAQPRQLITSARPAAAQVMSHTATTTSEQNHPAAELSENTGNEEATGSLKIQPLFGERPKTAAQIDEEIHFLNDCDQNFASRYEASDFFAARGWDYVADRQLDTAAYRFNLAWLLNDRNADAYWGLGVVSYQKDRLPEAIRMLKKGLSIADTNAVLMADLATLLIKQYQLKPDSTDLTEAETILIKAVSLSPTMASAYQKLAMINLLQTEYDKAWEYFHRARSLDLSVLDLTLLNDLLAKRPDPQGVFK